MKYSLPLATLLLCLLTGCTPEEEEIGESAITQSPVEEAADLSTCAPDDGGLDLPDGFCAQVVAEDLGPARHLAVDAEGDVYVQLREVSQGGGTVALRDTTGDGRADVIRYFGEHAGTGIAVREGALYVAPLEGVYRYVSVENTLVPEGEPEQIVGGLPEQTSHTARGIAFDDGSLYVNVGAPSNACQVQSRSLESPGQDPCPQLERQGGIWRFDADEPGQTQEADGERFATGLRNAFALDALGGDVYAVQHGRDQLDQLFPDDFDTQERIDLPAEEFVRLEEGAHYGWPYCYYDPFQEAKVLAPEYGGDGEAVGRCAGYEDPIVAFPAHWAPNDLVFYTAEQFPERYHGGAFIAFHGSWNRAPELQRGYNVVFQPFEGGEPTGDYEVFAEGFAGTEQIVSPGDAEHRPTGLAVGPDGALYVSDSVEGRVWRVWYVGG